MQTKESRWKSRLAEKEAQLNRIFGEEDKLAKNIAAMIESLDEMETSDDNVEESLEGMQRKLEDIESAGMSESFSQMSLQQAIQTEEVVQEITSLKDELDSEREIREDLEEKVAHMSQVMSTFQGALRRQKKSSKALHQLDGVSKTLPRRSKSSRSVTQAKSMVSSLDLPAEGLTSSNIQNTSSKDTKVKSKRSLGIFKSNK